MAELIPHLNDRSTRPDPNGSSAGDDGQNADIQVALNRVTHDINNPLAIISGNAQFLLELSQALDLDPDIVKPIEDIEEASQRLANMVSQLSALSEIARRDGLTGDGV